MKQQKGDNIKHFSYFGGKILPNSYQFLENCQNSGDFRKSRPRYAQCNACAMLNSTPHQLLMISGFIYRFIIFPIDPGPGPPILEVVLSRYANGP